MPQTMFPGALLEIGEKLNFTATEQREINVVGGERPYLWIGNADTPMYCYGTLDGAKLKKLAKEIIAAFDSAEAEK